MMRLGTRISSVDPPVDSFSQRKNKTFPVVCSEDTWQTLETFIVYKAEEGGVIGTYCVEARDVAKHPTMHRTAHNTELLSLKCQ